MALPERLPEGSEVRGARPERAARDARGLRAGGARGHPLGDLEIQFFCWFGAERLDDLGTRVKLIEAWGFCERHALGFLAVEASLNDGWLFQPAVVYGDLVERGQLALRWRWIFQRARIATALSASEQCQPCQLGLAPEDEAEPRALDIVDEGRRMGPLVDFAKETRAYWAAWVCGTCAGTASPARCRPHLLADLDDERCEVDLASERARVADIVRRADAYAASFGWAQRGTDTAADRAGLIGAAGWCAGWRQILEWLT